MEGKEELGKMLATTVYPELTDLKTDIIENLLIESTKYGMGSCHSSDLFFDLLIPLQTIVPLKLCSMNPKLEKSKLETNVKSGTFFLLVMF